jgi:nicotinamide riboside transporter PnuC
VNRSGKAASFWQRYSSRSSSAIAARIMARSSLCLGVVRRTAHVLRFYRLLLYSGVRHAVFSVSVSRHGWFFWRLRHSRNS